MRDQLERLSTGSRGRDDRADRRPDARDLSGLERDLTNTKHELLKVELQNSTRVILIISAAVTCSTLVYCLVIDCTEPNTSRIKPLQLQINQVFFIY